ncbi:hypothetical protein [Actinoplanes aureus]|jgi:hypothetical protein|uniref:Secreted protein n=1 Tax=Actinoplanes aureus TaxID=2792083 RepID=A0A931FYR9_9ACTN|nr:hypothetical protein [Actinoplanes aureus]MBG0563910.1 hypothetical protein [Actinoplanes aureus]
MTQRFRRTGAALGAAALLATVGLQHVTTTVALASTNWIMNDNLTGGRLGVIRNRNAPPARYDALLPNNQYTDRNLRWNTAGGWYTGPGYCTRQWRLDSPDGTLYRQWPNLGPGRHLIGTTTSYQVSMYRATDSNCADDS